MKIFKKAIMSILLLLAVAIPGLLVGCVPNNNNNNNNGDSSVASFQEQCVESLKSALNKLKNNENDILNGFGIYNTRNINEEDETTIYFESIKEEGKYFASYYRYFSNTDEYLKKYVKYDYRTNDPVDGYLENSDGTFTLHTIDSDENLTTQMLCYLFASSGVDITTQEGEFINCYEVDNRHIIEITYKYQIHGIEYIVKYTINNGKLKYIETTSYNHIGSNTYRELVELKYNISVDAYDKYYEGYWANQD